jgi:phosphoglycolate phosphatase
VRQRPSRQPPAPSLTTIQRPFRLIVFDLDGTLVDSRRDIADAANAVLASYGAPRLPEERIGRMVGDGAAMLIARACAASGIDQPPDALDRFVEIYGRRLLVHTRPYTGVAEVLTTLGSRATLAVLTNKPLASTREILAGLDLARHFSEDAVVGGDGPFPRKPDPSGLQHLQSATRSPASATLLVGDSVIDWRTAKAAGTSICIARYGFGFEAFSAETLAPGDLTIDAPTDLLRVS